MTELSKRLNELNENFQLLLKAFFFVKSIVFASTMFSKLRIINNTLPNSKSRSLYNSLNNSKSKTLTLLFVKLKEISNKKVIAEGVIELVNAGLIIYGRSILEFERQVKVLRIVGEESEPLYLTAQGGATTIEEVVGGYVVWSIYFIQF